MPRYFGFGLVIDSELELPELPPATDLPADLEIAYGGVPDHLDSIVVSGVMFEASETQFLIKLPPIAKFLLSGGNRILVDPCYGADSAVVRGVLLSSVMPPLLRQRGALVLHAGGAAIGAGVVLVAGASGSGKSTLVSHLAARGIAITGDDFATVRRQSDGTISVVPGCVRPKLWEDAAVALGFDPSVLRRVRPELRRYHIDVGDRVVREPLPLTMIFLLDTHDEDGVQATRLLGQHAFLGIRNQIRGLPAVDKLNLDERHFAEVAAIASSVPVYSLQRPRRSFSVEDLADRILQLAG